MIHNSWMSMSSELVTTLALPQRVRVSEGSWLKSWSSFTHNWGCVNVCFGRDEAKVVYQCWHTVRHNVAWRLPLVSTDAGRKVLWRILLVWGTAQGSWLQDHREMKPSYHYFILSLLLSMFLFKISWLHVLLYLYTVSLSIANVVGLLFALYSNVLLWITVTKLCSCMPKPATLKLLICDHFYLAHQWISPWYIYTYP